MATKKSVWWQWKKCTNFGCLKYQINGWINFKYKLYPFVISLNRANHHSNDENNNNAKKQSKKNKHFFGQIFVVSGALFEHRNSQSALRKQNFQHWNCVTMMWEHARAFFCVCHQRTRPFTAKFVVKRPFDALCGVQIRCASFQLFSDPHNCPLLWGRREIPLESYLRLLILFIYGLENCLCLVDTTFFRLISAQL